MAKLKLQKIGDNYTLNKYTIILAHRNQKKYGQIHNIDNESVSIECNLNSRDTISFSVYKHMDKMKESLWSNIKDLRLVYVKELDEYFSINVSFSDSEKQIKNVTGTSLCESELGQTIIYNFECNTEGDIGRDDYEQPTVFCRDLSSLDPNSKDYKKAKQSSLLHRVMSKCPHYKIKHVDSSLMNIQRSFSVDGTSVYDFFTGECAEQFNCIFTFNSTDRSVSVYDLYTVCLNTSCNYRGDNTEFETIVSDSSVCKCPKCNGTNLKYFGEDTTIFVNKNNLTDEVTFETDVDSIKNCFKLEAGDDTMTAAIRSINPNGSDYIYYISPEQKEDMSAELVSRLNSYNAEYEKSKPTYEKLMTQIYECIDKIVYYTSSMMPNTNNNDIDSKASDEIKKLTVSNLSPVGLSSVTESTSTATANSAIKNLAKVYVNSGKFKIEIESGEFVYVGTDANGYHYGTWYGSIRLTNYSDEEDTALSSMMSIKVYDNYEYFLDQKIKKNIANDDNGDKSIYNVLAIESLSNFKTALTYYALNRLISFYDAIQGVIDILIEADQSSDSADLYNSIYVPYYNKLQACQSEIDKRQATIDEWEHSQDLYDEQKQEIQSSLNFEDYLGEDLYTEFCSYRREQKYSNSNYISDGLDNSELFDNAKEFLETAENEIIKSGEHQHSISSTLYNLLLIKDFKRIVDKFELGNWIRVGVDEDIYRLRLISFGINGTSIQNLSVEFSDLTKVVSSSSDLENVISQAQQMATSYGNVETQANKGNIASNTFKNMQEEGFNSALYKIKNSDNEEWTFSKHGLLGKSYDDVSNDYLPEQIAFTHNVMAFTDDNWKTSCTALGKMTYTLGGTKYTEYGLNSKFVISGKVIAGDIYSANYSASGAGTHLNLNTGDFSLADSKIVYNNNTNKLTLKGVTIDWATTTTPTISDINGLNDYLVQLDGRIQTYSQETQPTWTDANSNHDGDLWIKPSTGITYVYISSTNKWNVTTDSNLSKLASSKSQIFTSTPTIPYYKGDLWVQGTGGDIKNCITTRTSGTYTSSDWVVSSKYTDDSTVTTFINGTYSTNLSELRTSIDGKAETWYQSSDPSSAWTTATLKDAHVNDLWFNTSKSKSYMYYKSGSTYSWKEVDGVPDGVYDKIDGKKAIYTSNPSTYSINDMYILETAMGSWKSGSILIATTSRTTASTTFTASHWKESVRYTDDTVANAVNDALLEYEKTVNAFNTKVHTALTGSATSEIGEDYIISPKIGGGYLYISDGTNGSVTIDPKQSKSSDGYIFNIKDKDGNSVIGAKTDGSATFSGNIISNDPSTNNKTLISDSHISMYGEKGTKLLTVTPTRNAVSGGEYKSLDFILGTNASKLGFNVERDDGLSTTYYAINNGGNMDGYTERHIWRSTERHEGEATFNSDIYTYNSDLKTISGRISYNNAGYVISTRSPSLRLNTETEDGTWTNWYILNNGLNPSNYTEKHIWYGAERHIGLSIFNSSVTCNGTLWTSSGGVSQSDRDTKNSIETLNSDKSTEFIYSLNPVKFKYNDGNSGRYHHGFIAQEVKESMGQDDWGVYVDGIPVMQETSVENVDVLTLGEPNDAKKIKGLRYEEILADLVLTVQTLNQRILELEEKGNE